MPHRTLTTALACLIATVAWAQPIPLRLGPVRHNAEWRDLGGGQYEIRATGFDPYILCEPLADGYDPAQYAVVSFELLCPQGLDSAEVFAVTTRSGWRSVPLGPVKPDDTWQALAAAARTALGDDWDGEAKQFRLDLGSDGGTVTRIRNLVLRPRNAAEAAAEQARAEAEAARLAGLAARVETALVKPRTIAPGPDMISASRLLRDDAGRTPLAVLGHELDLPSLVGGLAATIAPPVALGPALVAGEGPDPANHTLVRVFSRYGLCEAQFLAYAPEVRGGVQVEAGRDAAGNTRLVTAPLADTAVRTLRVFSHYGLPLAELQAPEGFAAPSAIAVADLDRTRPGEELAVAPSQASGAPLPVLVMGLDGASLGSLEVPLRAAERGTVTLAGTAEGRLLVSVAGAEDCYLLTLGQTSSRRLAYLPARGYAAVYPSAFPGHPFAVTGPGEQASLLRRLMPDGGPGAAVDVGTREGLFWFTAGGAFSKVGESAHVKHALFAHLRTDFASPNASTPDFTRTDEAFWAGAAYRDWVRQRLATYDSDPPTCWEPCFTHRWFTAQAKAWAEARDTETGLPAYTLVDRENRTGYYGEFGATNAFVSGTYAPGLAPLEGFYTLPLRGFLRELAPRFRANPEHFVALEPNHEMEINAESAETHGDYNPSMIRGFYRYLVGLYGSLESLNRIFGTPFTPDRFDAPRDLRRGPWDAYSADNPYYLVWMRYLNYCIYRVVAGTYREALLAGFPPEAIKCHQIPDSYAIASLTAFSKPAQRVTPIDWNLTAGVGYGFTRYGVWYSDRHNPVQGAHSSGFDSMVIGEYQSLTPDVEAAYQQLRYLRDNGVQFIHCMNWPQGHDRGFNASLAAALQRLVAGDEPRSGPAGGTGQVRPWGSGPAACDLVSLGTGTQKTGLIKSVREDGSWEGSVYLVPFHAHVEVATLLRRQALYLRDQPLETPKLSRVGCGNTFEVSLQARSGAAGDAVSLRVLHHGLELPALRLVLPVTGRWQPLRALVRVQAETDDLVLQLGSGEAGAGTWLKGDVAVRDLLVTRQAEQTTQVKKGVFEGERHRGGVTFDVLP